jgi:hypothetical protein
LKRECKEIALCIVADCKTTETCIVSYLVCLRLFAD